MIYRCLKSVCRGCKSRWPLGTPDDDSCPRPCRICGNADAPELVEGVAGDGMMDRCWMAIMTDR